MEATSEEIRIEYMSVEEINKWPRNPKDHDLHEIRKSFERFGFVKPILVDEGTGLLVAGHGRIDTLKFLERDGKNPPKGVFLDGEVWKLPVLRGVQFDNPAEAEAFLIADNRLGEIGGWKTDILSEMLGEIIDVDGALEGIGFDYAEALAMSAGHELDLDAHVDESGNKGYRTYNALLTPEEYRFIIDTLVMMEKEMLSEQEYAIPNKKGYCLYRIIKEWDEARTGS